MIVVLNGKDTEIDDGMTVLGLLNEQNIAPDTVVVECNRAIVSSDAFGDTQLCAGDHLEVLRFVGGG